MFHYLENAEAWWTVKLMHLQLITSFRKTRWRLVFQTWSHLRQDLILKNQRKVKNLHFEQKKKIESRICAKSQISDNQSKSNKMQKKKHFRKRNQLFRKLFFRLHERKLKRDIFCFFFFFVSCFHVKEQKQPLAMWSNGGGHFFGPRNMGLIPSDLVVSTVQGLRAMLRL